MVNLIQADSISKVYHLKKGGDGFLSMFKNLVRPEWAEHQALDKVTLTLRQSECVGFLGPNGAGKSTLIKILCGIQQPDSGTLSVLGANPYRQSRRFYKRIAAVFGHKSSLWWDLSLNTSFESGIL